MISFGLVCSKGHSFEAWFKDSATYERQVKRGLVTCAHCGSAKVEKALMAPRLAGTKKGRRDKDAAEPTQAVAKAAPDPQAVALMKELQELRRKVEENAEYVGDRFAEEARKIHYEETEKRSIYGEASEEESKALAEEGVEFARIPWLPRTNS
ncbi:MAG: DUF1178 family protein [Alphaproteobacteria bacterium]|nr:DUF1178 family protein [Alphaproteobacteria bacterium]